MASDFVIDGVIVHELAHIKHLNHSKEFYAEIVKYLPYYPNAAKLCQKNTISSNVKDGYKLRREMSSQKKLNDKGLYCLDGTKSHGKVFEDDGDNVWIWIEVEDILVRYKNGLG